MKTYQELKEIKKSFMKKYSSLWTIDQKTGLNAVGIGGDDINPAGEVGLIVRSIDKETLDKVPDTFMDAVVYKKVIGNIKALKK